MWQGHIWCASANRAHVTAHGGNPYFARIRTSTTALIFLEKPVSFCTILNIQTKHTWVQWLHLTVFAAAI
jgi:hypothetical protein